MKRFCGAVSVCLFWAGVAAGSPAVMVGQTGRFCPEFDGAAEHRLVPSPELRATPVAGHLLRPFGLRAGAGLEAVERLAGSRKSCGAIIGYMTMKSGPTWTPQRNAWHRKEGCGSMNVDMALLGSDPLWGAFMATSDDAVLAGQFVNMAMDSGWTSIGAARVVDVGPMEKRVSVERGGLLGFIVPAPGAIILGGLGLGVLGSLRRRSAW